MQNRKLKTFYIMKPNIIRDLKYKLLQEKLENKRVKKLCKSYISIMMMSYLSKKGFYDY